MPRSGQRYNLVTQRFESPENASKHEQEVYRKLGEAALKEIDDATVGNRVQRLADDPVVRRDVTLGG